MRFSLFGLLLLAMIVSGCGINPVTGKSQITFMNQQQENAIGQQQFLPSQQSQGGSYIVDKSLSRYVNRIGQSLAKHSAQPDLPYEFVVLNNDEANAWALPGGKIAINRGLLVIMEDEAQLAAVLAHEIVHAAARHGAEHHARGTGIELLGAILQTQTNNRWLQQGANLGGGAIHAHYGRDNEFEADHYSIAYMVADGYDPQAAVELQQTFVELSQGRGQSNILSRLLATHPPSTERVKKNQEQVNKLGNITGKRNRAEYQKAIKQLVTDQEAYQHHQNALVAAKKKDWQTSLSLTQQAIKLQPNEAHFHITKGRILSETGKSKDAVLAFNQAIELDSQYFSGFFHRGLIHQKLKNYSAAKKDFTASNQRLETGVANYYLGEIALEQNDRLRAISYYRRAREYGGDTGKAAASRLRQLGAS